MAVDVRASKEIGGASAPKALRVGFVLSKGFTLSAFALFVDTLRLAADHEDRAAIGAGKRDRVDGQHRDHEGLHARPAS